MATDKLHIFKSPKLEKPRLLLGFTGWMDSGEVSTGTIRSFVEKLDAESIAQHNLLRKRLNDDSVCMP